MILMVVVLQDGTRVEVMVPLPAGGDIRKATRVIAAQGEAIADNVTRVDFERARRVG